MPRFEKKLQVVSKSRLNHLNRQIPPEAHTPMYNWHKFWSRKTWNVVAEFIKNYCPENGIVFDPFAGSGVVAMEALKNNRRAIICDILPVATEIARLTIKNVSTTRLHEAFERVEKRIKKKILSLYQTKCRKCGKEFPFTCAIWEKKECVEIRYEKCPACGDRRTKKCTLESFDKNLLRDIEATEIKEWYPKQRLYHVNGKPFKEKQHYESLDELFTKRNLQALAWLMEAIEDEKSRDLRDFLKIGFSSIVHLCSRMCPISEAGHFTPFSSAWIQHSYWYPSGPYMEQNVWYKFESAVMGHQGLIKAKEESNEYFKNVRFGSNYKDVINYNADLCIYTGSSLDLMEDMIKEYGETGCVDYVFTDPPYDASIQFGELAYLWVAWLKKDKGYLERIRSDEVVRNERQDKDFDVYHSLLRRSFEDTFKILKPDSYLTVTFHNPTFKVRNATIYAGVFAGFEFQKIHHQELARPSAKSLLQPFGSAQGDFYLRFYKPQIGEKVITPKEIDENRFEKIVVETTKRVLAERGEETPYTIIINTIDPELAKHGYFSELHTGLDVKTVLKNHKDKEFILVPVKLGGSEGHLWWFKDPSIVPHLKTIPLSERVEQTVLRKLQQRGKVTFTEMWDAISTEFPNSLTSDSMSIIEALKAYAKPVSGGYWLIKSNVTKNEIEREHTEMIIILAEIGKSLGHKIWIGKKEQSHRITHFPNKSGELRQYVSINSLGSLKNIQNPQIVDDIDLLWIDKDKIVCSFEIEATTTMTESLNRGSNIDSIVSKFLVMPEEREAQLARKMNSPMFAKRFGDDSWNVVFFDALREEYWRRKGKTDIFKLVDKKIVRKASKVTDGLQNELFG
ncbi:MAG: DNA methyltransferase [Candidatus Zixiibacteriota bacterium]